MAWPEDEENLGGARPMSPGQMQSGLSSDEPAPRPETPFPDSQDFRPLSPQRIAQEQNAQEVQAAREERARQAAEAEAERARQAAEAEAERTRQADERTRRSVETKRLREQGVELTVDDQNQAVPVTREDGSKVFKPDWVGAPRFDAEKKSWLRDRRDERGNVSPVDLWDNRDIDRDNETGDLYFTDGGVRKVVGKDEDYLRRRAIGQEIATLSRSQEEQDIDLDKKVQEWKPLEEDFNSKEKTYKTAADTLRSLREIGRKNPKFAEANADKIRSAQEAFDAERKAFDPLKKQKDALEARRREVEDARIKTRERKLNLYTERDALETAARRPEFSAPAAAAAGETPDFTKERETHGVGGDAYRLPDIARDETDFRDRMRKLDVEAERLAPPSMALAPDPAREAKLAEINARRKQEIAAWSGRKAAVQKFTETDNAITTELAGSEGRERELVARFARDEAPLGRDLAAGRITLEEYRSAVGAMEADIAKESSSRSALNAQRADLKKKTWTALQQPSEFPESLLRRTGSEVDLDPLAVQLRATGRAAAFGTSEADELYDTLLEIKDAGKIHRIGGRPIQDVIKEVVASKGTRVADLLTSDEQRAVADGLRGGLVGLQNGIFGSAYSTEKGIDLGQNRYTEKLVAGKPERETTAPALSGEETLSRPVGEEKQAALFWGQIMAQSLRGGNPPGLSGGTSPSEPSPKDPRTPYQQDIIRQRDEIQNREFKAPANWAELSAADKRAALEDFQTGKDKALETFYSNQESMGGDRAAFVKELRGEKKQSFPSALWDELAGRVRAALVSPYAGVQDVSLGRHSFTRRGESAGD